MTTTMSLAARREMLLSIRQRYLSAKRPEKTKILDGFVAATGYDRKYALVLLSKKSSLIDTVSLKPKVLSDNYGGRSSGNYLGRLI